MIGKGKNKNCILCQKNFYVYPYRANITKFCSPACYWKSKKNDVKTLENLALARKKRSDAIWNKGKKGLQVAWNKGIPNFKIRGENNPNWHGGSKSERKTAMGRIEYTLWRTAVFMRDNYTCQTCSQYSGELEADHIKPWALYPELRYAIDNGRTLCKPCHRQTDTWGYKTSKLLRKEDNIWQS